MSDPLNTRVDDFKTGEPVLPAGRRQFLVKDAKVTESEDGEQQTAVFQLQTTEDLTSTDGESIPAGHVVFARVPLTSGDFVSASGKEYSRTEIQVAKGIAAACKACRVGGFTVREFLDAPDEKLAEFVGKTADIKVTVKKETDEWPESNFFNFDPPRRKNG